MKHFIPLFCVFVYSVSFFMYGSIDVLGAVNSSMAYLSYSDDIYDNTEDDYEMYKEIIGQAYNHGYMTASAHDWMIDVYSNNIGASYVINEIQFYGDDCDCVFLELNSIDFDNQTIHTDDLLINILDLAYSHGYISASGHDWILDEYRSNEGYGYVKYTLDFYGYVEDTVKFYLDEALIKDNVAIISIEWIKTPNSTCFSDIGFDNEREVLGVTFRDSGATYYYYGITNDMWESFNSADSLGGFYNEYIKGNYNCEKMHEPIIAPETSLESAVTSESEIKTEYILNKNKKKFHYPTCSSVGLMSDKNKEIREDFRSNIISDGYEPCQICNP